MNEPKTHRQQKRIPKKYRTFISSFSISFIPFIILTRNVVPTKRLLRCQEFIKFIYLNYANRSNIRVQSIRDSWHSFRPYKLLALKLVFKYFWYFRLASVAGALFPSTGYFTWNESVSRQMNPFCFQ